MRSNMDHTVLPANYTMPAFTPQPKRITALWLVLIFRPTESRRLSRPGWLLLHTEIKCRLRESNPDTVTHTSTNRAQRKLTWLIETNEVTTTPRRRNASLKRLMLFRLWRLPFEDSAVVSKTFLLFQQFQLHETPDLLISTNSIGIKV